jgi:hypothetical protein
MDEDESHNWWIESSTGGTWSVGDEWEVGTVWQGGTGWQDGGVIADGGWHGNNSMQIEDNEHGADSGWAATVEAGSGTGGSWHYDAETPAALADGLVGGKQYEQEGSSQHGSSLGDGWQQYNAEQWQEHGQNSSGSGGLGWEAAMILGNQRGQHPTPNLVRQVFAFAHALVSKWLLGKLNWVILHTADTGLSSPSQRWLIPPKAILPNSTSEPTRNLYKHGCRVWALASAECNRTHRFPSQSLLHNWFFKIINLSPSLFCAKLIGAYNIQP